jgi:hypothetical protein
MDNVNQPQGQGPQEYPPTPPYRFTPDWSGGEQAPQGGQGYGPPTQGPPTQGPSTQGPQWQQAGPPQYDPRYAPQFDQHYGPQGGPPPYGQDETIQYAPPGQPGSQGPEQPKTGWKYSRRLRWTAGVSAAVLLCAGGALVGLKLSGSGSGANMPNAAQAVALNTALSSSASGNCPTPVAGSVSKTGKHGCLRPRLRPVRGMYGEVAYHTPNGTENLAFERGTVVSSSGGVLVVKAANGTEWSWNVASSSVVRESGKPVTSSDLTSGTWVFVGGQVIGSSKDARLVVIRVKKPSSGSSTKNSSTSGSSAGSAT